MKIFLYIAALATVVLAAPSQRKNLPDRRVLFPLPEAQVDPTSRSKHNRIIGGQIATPHEFPHQVGLTIDNLYFCGGSIIGTNWVITSGHCCTNAITIEVLAGAHNKDVYEESQVRVNASRIIKHPGYNDVTFADDICLLELASNLTFNSYVHSIALTSVDIGPNVMCTSCGWGYTSDFTGETSSYLKKVTDPTITNSQCYSVYGNIITDQIVCTAFVNGAVCVGDTGGPLIYGYGSGSRLVGVTSFVPANGCQSGLPDGHQRIFHHLDWIETETGITPP